MNTAHVRSNTIARGKMCIEIYLNKDPENLNALYLSCQSMDVLHNRLFWLQSQGYKIIIEK